MSTSTLTRDQVTADKLAKAAERAATIAGLPANPGPPVAPPAEFPTRPVPSAKPAPDAVVKPRRLAMIETGLLPETIKADAAYNESVAAWTADAEKLEAMKSHLCDGPESVTVAELAKRREAVNVAELTLAQTSVRLHRDHGVRAAARAADMKVYAEGCEESLATTVESVAKRLNATGISVESQPNYAANPNSAEIAFSHLVFQSVDWRDANQKLSEAQSAHSAEVEAVTACRTQLAKAEAYLATVVRKLAG